MSTLCGFSDVYVAVQGAVTVPNTGTAAAQNNRNKGAPSSYSVSEINNTQTDNAKDIDVVINIQKFMAILQRSTSSK